MYYQNEVDSTDKKQRTRIIAIATFVAVVILLLIVAIIVTASNKAAKNTISNIDTATPVVEEVSVEKEGGKSEGDSPIGTISTETAEEGKAQTESTPENTPSASVSIGATVIAAESTDKMPTTGPLDTLPIALLLGATTMCVSSFAMAKREK